jgi:mono/diheme cytochrome c family protein
MIMAICTLLAIVAGWYILTTPGRKPVMIFVYQSPIISVEKRIQDIGRVQTDSKVNTSFLIYNIGGKHLRIMDVETSCGCTVADISKHVVAPGDFTRIQVTLDTSIKLGKIRKEITVHSNDPKRPDLPLFVVGEVLPKKVMGHAEIDLKSTNRLVLFQGKCATCHVQQGVGKTGKALFVADCAMCHGINAQGNHGSGPSLLGGNYDDEAFRKHIHDVIANGSPQSPQMPPFAQSQGGPLTEDEINSLVSFLKFQAMQQKMGLLNQPDEGEAEDEAAFQQALQQPH